MARDVNEFWQNLVAGKDCITEIPKDRWDWREYYGDPQRKSIKPTSNGVGLLTEWVSLIPCSSEFRPGSRIDGSAAAVVDDLCLEGD